MARHHNTKGTRQVKRGKTRRQVQAIAKRLKIPVVTNLMRCEQPGPTFGTPYCRCRFCIVDTPEYRGYER